MTHESPAPDQLRDVNFGMSWTSSLLVGCFAAAFVYFSYIPLWPTDIWGHVAYGEWILQHGQLPTEDPFIDLAKGTQLVNTAWAAQIFFAKVVRSGGPEGLSYSYAVLSLAIYLMAALLFMLRTGRPTLAVFAAILMWLVAWERHLVVRPELFGALFFVTLLALLAVTGLLKSSSPAANSFEHNLTSVRRWGVRTATVVLFVTWSNVHGSFAVGLVLLGIMLSGTVIERWKQLRDFRGVSLDSEVRDAGVLLALAAMATLVNPFGIGLPIYVIGFGAHPNMALISEWQSPDLLSVTGVSVLTVALLFITTIKFRDRPPTATEWLLLGVFTFAVCTRQRMVTWYAPVALLVLTPMLVRLWELIGRGHLITRVASVLEHRSKVQVALSVLLVWLAFTFTPISKPVLGGRTRSAEQLFNSRTPLGVAQALQNIELRGRVANPQWWGDWLSWAGPRDMRLMMTTNTLHLVPAEVFNNYHDLLWAKPGLESRLAEFNVRTLIVDLTLQTELAEFVRTSPDWEIEYEDRMGLIANRKAGPM